MFVVFWLVVLVFYGTPGINNFAGVLKMANPTSKDTLPLEVQHLQAYKTIANLIGVRA